VAVHIKDSSRPDTKELPPQLYTVGKYNYTTFENYDKEDKTHNNVSYLIGTPKV